MSSIAADARIPPPAHLLPPEPSSSSIRRKRQSDHRSSSLVLYEHHARSDGTTCNGIADQSAVYTAQSDCFDSDNAVFSCFPTGDTIFSQHQWAYFVWNSRLPQFAQTNEVDLLLYNAESLEQVLSITNQTNPSTTSGSVSVCVNDTWFGADAANWDGENITSAYYWVITPSTKTEVIYQSPQSTFSAVQTTYADSVLSSRSSASSASAASAASASSASAASSRASAASASITTISGSATVGTGVGSGANSSYSGIPTANPSSRQPGASGTASPGSVQSLNSNKFPDWAIAVIVVLGFLALVAFGILTFFIMRRVRNRRHSMLSHRGSMNSASPMMANAAAGATAQSPLLGAAVLGAAGGAGAAETGEGSHRAVSPTDGHDGASTFSRQSDTGLFSGADAAIMAQAFRTALRKPEFGDRPDEEGESPESDASDHAGALLGHELAEEGRDIRSVGSSRGVKVETLSDTADDDAATAATTVHDRPH
ncbi:uncharacterized protein LAESUDRAFT_808813 [Laetiporus sulphureus 93-53]|uniref:Uncharacterized protein n=1 Tax=Laetiporus sulphureus 93-53 TaxID=1314785 RepID=A0A165HKL8_9APHY|nr:uncharacterized protein LAESUDRAFT_808813 [Laetiporus sulphureus 93-53]KZT11853.1 hypothetical protein LAESUDRAFT_808813 [Laetiporus sulphureus 93-53]